jgi:hypothetical protein
MRTFPRSLATLRELVDRRGDRLRALSFAYLERLADSPIQETLTVLSRSTTITTTVERWLDGSLRVVLRALMKPRFLPFGNHVAMDGFYKRPDGSVAPMTDKEFNEF